MHRRLGIALALVVASSASPNVFPQEGGAQGPAVLAGNIVAPGGRPATGVTVWLVKGAYNQAYRSVANVTTDERGHFAFADLDEKAVFNHKNGPPRLLARDQQGRLGWTSHLSRYNAAEETHQIELMDVSDVRGRVVDGAGAPIAGARISPVALYHTAVNPLRSIDGVLFRELVKEYEVQTAGDGAFVLHRLPKSAQVMATVSAPAFGSPRVQWQAADSVIIRLERAGRVEGAVAGVKDPKAAAGIKLDLRLQSPHQQRKDAADPVIYFFAEATIKEDGSFGFEGVVPGTYTITARLQGTVPFFGEPTPTFEVKSGAVATAPALVLHPAVAVRGRVIDKESGAGIKDVSIGVIDADRNRYEAWATTDDEGRYTAYVKPGSVRVAVQRVPTSHVSAAFASQTAAKVDATRDVEYPDIKLDPAAKLSGIVVDPAGKPVIGATIHCLVPRLDPVLDKEPNPLTDSQGRFTVAGLDPMDNAPLRARTARAVTAQAVVLVPAQQKGPARLVVSEDQAFRLRGIVVDAAGKPVPDAMIGVQWNFQYASKRYPGWGSGARLQTLWADADGRFETEALWPSERYRIEVTAKGFANAESVPVTGRPGVVHDVGSIFLIRNNGVVQGKVVDSAGNPVDGARVFNAGDAPRSISSQTKASGEFRLEGLFVGPVYVFAQKPDYRFTGMRVNTGSPDVSIKLLKLDEPSPLPERFSHAPSFAEDQQLARKLLEKLWALPPVLRETGVYGIVESMARLDPPQALRWADQLGGRYRNRVRALAAENLAATDMDEMLALLSQVDGDTAYRTLYKLTKQYLKSDSAKALRFAEEAVVRARAQEQPTRAHSLAEMGNLVRQLGKDDVGRKLIDEAANEAEKMGTEGLQPWARGAAAEALAPFDLSRAMQLVDPIRDPRTREDCLSKVAVALAPHDLGKALEIVGKLAKSSTLPGEVRMKIAYRLAPSQPAKAIQVVEGMDNEAAVKMKADGFAWLAVALAPSDKKLAWSLIDRSLDVYVRNPEAFRGWSNASVMAARVVGQAREIGYPDLEAVVCRVLALRQAAPYDSPAHIVEAQVATAMVLALADPLTARQLLEDVEPRSHLIGSGFSSIQRKHWLLAWTLADPTRVVELFDKELAALKDQPNGNLQGAGLTDIVEVLTTPPAERAQRLLRYYGGFWFPGEE